MSGCDVKNSVISPNVRVGKDALLDGVIAFDDVQIGEGAIIRRAVIDKNVVIPPGTKIGVDSVEDAKRFTVSDGGVVAIGKNVVIE